MAAIQTQIRRGTASQCDLLTPADGEVIWDQTNNRTRVGDGVKAGGHHQVSAADVQGQKFVYATAVSGTNDIVLTVTQPPASYAQGQAFEFKAGATSTGTVRVDVGPGLVAVYKFQSGSLVACGAGDIVSGVEYRVTHNGTYWQLSAGGAGVTSVTGSGGVSVSPTTGAPVVSLDTNNALGIGCLAFACYTAGGTISSGSTTAGSNISIRTFKPVVAGSDYVTFQVSNPSGGGANLSPSGTWRNISGMSLTGSSNEFGLWIRTA